MVLTRMRDGRLGVGIAISLGYAVLVAYRITHDSFVVGGSRYYNVLDDALISMRYGWNLAHGNGLVWNPGEYVEGYTNPLIVLISAGCLLVASKNAAVLMMQILGALWVLLAGWLAAGLMRDLLRTTPHSERGARFAESLVLAGTLFYYPLFILSLHGMETGLLTTVLLLGVRLALRAEGSRQLVLLSCLLSLAFLCRPDGALPVALLLGALVLRGKSLLRCFGPFLGVIAGHLLFRHAYYEAWLPNTYTLRIAGVSLAERVADGLAIGRLFLAESWPLLLLAAAGVLFARSRDHALLALLAGSQLAYHVYAGGDFLPDLWRFAVPGIPLLFVLATDAALRGWRWMRPLSAAWVPLLVVALVFGFTNQRYAGRWMEDNEKRVRQIRGDVTAARAIAWVTRPEARVGVLRAGAVPYYTGRPAVDFLGKMDPTIARTEPHRDVVPAMTRLGSRMWPGHAKYDLEYSIVELQPDVVLRMAWFDEDVSRWGREHYVPLMLGQLAVHLRKGSPHVKWSKLACEQDVCRLR